MRAPRWTGFLAGLLATGSFYPAHSQTTATLLGTVRDSSGSVVPQARVTARHVLTSFTRAASTDDTGSYLIPNLPVGDYSLMAGSVTIASGLPVWIRTDRDNSLTGVGFDRPDLVGNPVRSHAGREDMIQQFFNTAAFVPNQPGRYGNAGRNLFSGPASSTTDLAVSKTWVVSERLGRVQFRTEFFNAWNQVNFGGPEARQTNRNFGRILSAGSPRIVQFALKYLF